MVDDPLLQPPLKGDERMEALARLIARLSSLSTETPLVNLLNIVTPAALPLLGEQFHILGLEGWNQAQTEADRRALIKKSIALHRHKGTPWAVTEALRDYLARPVILKEWFQYDGSPYFFRAGFDVTDSGLNDAELSAVFGLVETWKNTRSWLDAIETSASIGLSLQYGAADITRTHARVYSYMDTPAPSRAKLNIGLAASGRSLSVLALSLPDVPPALPLPVGFAAAVRERTRGAIGIYQEKKRPSAVSDVTVLACIARTRSRIAAE